MIMESETIRLRLQQLRTAGMGLADLLQFSADRLDADGDPPPMLVSESLHNFREQFSALTSLFDPGNQTGDATSFESLSEIDTELERRDTLKHATAIARSILLIQLTEGQAVPGFDQLQSSAREMVASLGLRTPPEEISQLLGGRHVWCDLLRMIRERDSLSDAEWTALNTTIENGLGRPLAIAVTRGRMRLSDIDEVPATPGSTQPLAPSALEVTSLSEGHAAAVPERVGDPAASVDMETQIATDVAQLAHEMGSDSHILRIDSSRSAGSRSAVSRAVTRARSESDAHLLPPNPTPATPDLDPLPSVSMSLPPAARESEALSDLAGPSQLDSEHSVFDDIEPISLHRKYTTPAPAPTQTAVTSNSTRAWRGPSRSVSTSSSIFEDDDEEREDKSGLVPEVKPSPANAPATDQANRSAALAEELFARARFADAAGPSANLAAMILNGQEEERVDLIPDLILHLIHEGRPGIAYHLSRCLESRNACLRPFVPSWLIRTWTFGQALVFPKGQLAGLLQDDLASRPTSDTQDSSRDWKLALSLLIRASTLRPSIIAPATRAASVLRNFDLQDSCVQLYNYCSRVGVYGERIQGVFPGLFKQSIAATPYADQLSKLRSDIKRWREAADTIRLKVQLASPLFQKTGWSLRAGTGQRFPDAAFDWRNWQMALSMAESLLEPVLQDRSGELSRVKADIEEISTQLSSTESPDGRRLFSQPEVRAYLRQVTTFAQRWLSLRAGSVKNEAQNYLPQAAVELRSEIQNRHEPVMEELQALASEHTSFEVRMAVACLMLSVNDVHGLVDPDTASESSEADPRHLLHSELLKISGLRLAATWEPAVDMHLLEDEILGFLCQPQPDWTTAYQMHLAQGNHPLAERIVSLAIWNNEEREALQGVLERDRRRQRTNFVRELHDVNQLLAESALLEILNESERKGFETRLARLQKIATAESDLSTGVTELDKVREALVKRRERETERMRVRLRQLSEPSSGSSVIETTTSQDHSEPSQQGWVMDFDR